MNGGSSLGGKSALARAARTCSPTLLVALGGALALLIPVLVFGPWLPLTDLVSFVGMDSYPPQHSYGPTHYATFQFTYIGHYALSRLLCDLHVGIPHQIVLLYLLQVTTCFVVVWRMLEHLIDDPWWRACGIALGTLAFWDGIFLWGGPLAYSLAATNLSVAMFLALREAGELERDSGTAIALLMFAAMLCHPFAAAFALILCGLRFLFVRRSRWQTVLLAAGVVLYAIVILRDSPATETSASGSLKLLFGLDRHQLWLRLYSLVRLDIMFVQTLFGTVSWTTRVVFVVLTSLHVVGFLGAPFLMLRRAAGGSLRMLAALNFVVGILYLLSWDGSAAPIPEWPERILTLYSPFTYLGGFVALTWFVRDVFRLRPFDRVPPLLWTVPGIVLLFVMAVQAPVFRFGDALAANYRETRDALLRSDLKNCYVVVSGLDRVRPFYLRCIPFLLFSDQQVSDRHITFATEWHFQDRHPSRLVETTFDLGRPWYTAEFSIEAGKIAMKLISVPKTRFPLVERTNVHSWGKVPALAQRQYDQALDLLAAGFYTSALEHFNSVIQLVPESAEAWNNAGVALEHVGQLKDAMDYFTHAIQRDPKQSAAHVNLASLLIATNRAAEAIPHLEQVKLDHPEQPEVAELLEKAHAQLAAQPLIIHAKSAQ